MRTYTLDLCLLLYLSQMMGEKEPKKEPKKEPEKELEYSCFWHFLFPGEKTKTPEGEDTKNIFKHQDTRHCRHLHTQTTRHADI